MDRLTAQAQVFAVASRAMYTDRMTIRRPASTKGATAGNVPSTAEVLATDIPCRIRPASADERELAGATQGTNAFVVKAPALDGSSLIQIDSKCELVIAARGHVPAQTLKAVSPLPNQGMSFEVVATKQA